MKRYYLKDIRQKSVYTGRPEGAWLQTPPSPAKWVNRRELARTFTAEEIEMLKKEWHYLAGCEVVPADSGESES